MITDGVKTAAPRTRSQVLDIAELVARSMVRKREIEAGGGKAPGPATS